MVGFYQALKKSNSITSYATKLVGEDVPEFMTYFILTQYMNVRPVIRVMNKDTGAVEVEYDIAKEIKSKRFEDKFKFMQKTFE